MKTRILRYVPGGADLSATARSALVAGYTHIWFSGMLYRVSVDVQRVTAAEDLLERWLRDAPFGTHSIEMDQ